MSITNRPGLTTVRCAPKGGRGKRTRFLRMESSTSSGISVLGWPYRSLPDTLSNLPRAPGPSASPRAPSCTPGFRRLAVCRLGAGLAAGGRSSLVKAQQRRACAVCPAWQRHCPYRASLARVGALLKLNGRLERVEDFADRRADLWPDAIPGNQRDLLYLCVARRRHVANPLADLRAARRTAEGAAPLEAGSQVW